MTKYIVHSRTLNINEDIIRRALLQFTCPKHTYIAIKLTNKTLTLQNEQGYIYIRIKPTYQNDCTVIEQTNINVCVRKLYTELHNQNDVKWSISIKIFNLLDTDF